MDLPGLAAELANVPGVVAVVLGGSRARSRATASSDTDLGLFYREAEPLDVDTLRVLVHELDRSRPQVTELHGWGPWVNGGAWTTIDPLGPVDLIYRSVDRVERTLHDLCEGRRQHDWHQQPPFGFTSVTYGGEDAACVPIVDEDNVVATLKQRVATYPDALRRTIVDADLWKAEFTVRNARKVAARGDARLTIAHLTRADHYLVQVLFALNRTWFVNDKSAVDQIEAFPKRNDYGERTAGILAGAVGLIERVEHMSTLVSDIASLAADLYKPRF